MLKKIGLAGNMVLRIILGTLVLIFFSIPFIRRIRKDYKADKKVSKWSIFFIAMALVLWLILVISYGIILYND
ncbi:hypothetical protein [Salinicoccus albus]|uniref:hypothetical protein n=1 Tax=Salinicoccus albus TaxID=418756 RepID=UPI0003819F95|nr:hypothetical protein [Salinicoccus albus]